jgi:diguanylate cyclase (GGDEF)-like protein
MAILCFVYTPAIWFTFNGLMAGAPYQVLLFITMILLSYYGKPLRVLLSIYLGEVFLLLIVWFASFGWNPPFQYTWGTLVTFVLAIALIILFLQKSKQQHLEINENLLDQSSRDSVTQLYNRRAMEGILERQENGYQEHEDDYIVIMLDIDDFKQINDRFGHTLGDSVLRSVAERISGAIREQDFAARYGGDEFIIALSVSGEEHASRIYERITANVCRINGYAFDLLVSAGSARRKECESLSALIALADQRMYEMKRTRAGKSNCDFGDALANDTPKEE